MKRIYKSNRVQRIKFTMRASIRFRGGVNRVHHRCKHLPLLNVCKSVQVNDSDTNDLPRSRQEFLSFLSCLTWLSVAERWRRTARERKKRGRERERERSRSWFQWSLKCVLDSGPSTLWSFSDSSAFSCQHLLHACYEPIDLCLST